MTSKVRDIGCTLAQCMTGSLGFKKVLGPPSSSWKPYARSWCCTCTLDHCFNVLIFNLFLHLLRQLLLNISDFLQNVLSSWLNQFWGPEFLLTCSGLYNLCRSWFCSGFEQVVMEKVTARDVGCIWTYLSKKEKSKSGQRYSTYY